MDAASNTINKLSRNSKYFVQSFIICVILNLFNNDKNTLFYKCEVLIWQYLINHYLN